MDFHRKNYLLSFQVEHQVLEDLTHNTKQKNIPLFILTGLEYFKICALKS